uniref:Uncharacterized protein n=1 Tax=Romanomermis culicivorax TaxID=13658 RepID=A0A915HLY8_ROMCU
MTKPVTTITDEKTITSIKLVDVVKAIKTKPVQIAKLSLGMPLKLRILINKSFDLSLLMNTVLKRKSVLLSLLIPRISTTVDLKIMIDAAIPWQYVHHEKTGKDDRCSGRSFGKSSLTRDKEINSYNIQGYFAW